MAFDPTITLGNILQVIGFLGGGYIFVRKLEMDLVKLQTKNLAQDRQLLELQQAVDKVSKSAGEAHDKLYNHIVQAHTPH